MQVKELSDNREKDLQEFFSSVQVSLSRTALSHRLGPYQGVYEFMAKDSCVLLATEDDKIVATASFLSLSDLEQKTFLITDLFKIASFDSFVTVKMVDYFLKKRCIEAEKFCLVFVEENMKAFDGVLELVAKKRGLQYREELIYSNIFSVSMKEEGGVEEIHETIDGLECLFYTDKKSRYFSVDGKKYQRAYVKVPAPIRNESTYLKIVEAGKKNACLLGCNTFVLLTENKLNLNQDYQYVNRKFELWNGEVGKRIDLCSRGILI